MDKSDPGPGYRLLAPPDPHTGDPGELVQEGDEFYEATSDQWKISGNWNPGRSATQAYGLPYRRKIYPTHNTRVLSDSETIMPGDLIVSRRMGSSRPAQEYAFGCKAIECGTNFSVERPLVPKPVLPVPEDISELAILVPSGPGPKPTVSPSPATPPARSESFSNTLSGLQNPNAPKSYTPNKYTRYIPTLDGRVVPVDVYCVSEAFHLGTCLKSGGALDAVNHARKKLLAPGQRGQKTGIQDIKEAHASLGRAIQLEEAALGRETT